MDARLVITIFGGILALTAGVALTFWHKVLDWAESSLFPWIKENIPSFEDAVKSAFIAIDNVTAPTREVIKKSWEKIRQYLLKQVVHLERQPGGKWLKRVISWVIKVLEEGKPVAKVVTEETLDWDELDREMREAYLRRQESYTDIDVTTTRDKELEEIKNEDELSMET